MLFFSTTLAASLLVTNIFAHPGHDHSDEAAERALFTKFSKKDLSHCAEKIKARGLEQRATARRAATARNARQKRGLSIGAPYLQTRADPIDTDHHSSVDYTADTAAPILFASNKSCILSPEVTQGPYWVEGEYVREDTSENQAGLSLILDAQILDTTTCEPVTNAVLEMWACNATGVYSGVVASGNGVGSADPSNLNNTFMRGLQPTDDDGVAQFTTIFPGHYSGRATHIHVMVHFNGTHFENGTYAGGYVSHVGQLFFDQSLISEVEATAVYSTNTQRLTLNPDDSILTTETANGHDPFVEYSFLGDSVEDGIFSWISFGVDLASQQTLTGIATLTKNGGVVNDGSDSGSRPSGRSSVSAGSPSSTAPTSSKTASSTSTSTSTSTGGAVPTVVPFKVFNSAGVVSTGLALLFELLGLL